MGLRTSAQLAQDFPTDTPAHVSASVARFESLVRQGFLGDKAEIVQIETALLTAVNALAEAFAAPSLAYAGAAGTTTRTYLVVPTYPLPYPSGGGQNAFGRYLDFLTGKLPYGFPPAGPGAPVSDGVHRLYGKPSASASVQNTQATLDANDSVAITVPAAKSIPGATFDIIEQVGASFITIGVGVPAGATFTDKGAATTTPPMYYYGVAYTPRALAEVGYDSTGNAVVYGPLTRY